jgi:hypothetical protein
LVSVSGVPSGISPSKPSTLTRGTTTTVSELRITFDAFELFTRVRTKLIAESLVSISSPCCCAMMSAAVGPLPITT